METLTATQPRTLEHLLPLAIRSHNGTSFSPEKRGESVVNDYSKELDSDLIQIREVAAKNSEIEAEAIEATCERYKTKYTALLSAYLHSHSNVISWMITGPANFPSARNQKRSGWADNHYKEFRTYRERALTAILKSFKKPVDPLEAYKKDLAQREAYQIKAKKIRAICRKLKGNREEMMKVLIEQGGLSESVASQVLIPDYAGRIGIPQWSLTNNLANIKRIKGRIAQIEALKALPVSEKEITGGVIIRDNTEANRVQIVFPNKPSDECRSELKSAGFRWAPSNSAWQAFRNQRNYSRGCEIIRKYYTESV